MTNYQIGDFLIRLKNASMANIKEVVFPKTKLVLEVAKILKIEKFLDSVEEKDGNVIVKLSIFSKKPVLSNVTIISKPGLRIYMSADELEKIKTPDVYILTTPKGVLSGKMAMKLRVGGEVIAKII
ncbi:MAG: 30S ribosomal protein S8 [Candidatus Woesebacteria bacterium]|nr:30S ribosomal protein S8 [Candidatus Woesebacteria bacterium]